MTTTSDELNLRKAIDRFFNKKLTGTQLLRTFAVYRGWQVPARLDSLVPEFSVFDLGNGAKHYFLFSDKGAYLECRNKIGIHVMGDYYVGNVSGPSAIDAIKDTVDVVNINPYCAQEVHYIKEQIAQLKTWSRIVKTELALETANSSIRGYQTIRTFDTYYFIMEDEKYVTLAPDPSGRKLAAIFTASDALDIFLGGNQKPSQRPIPIGGEALFSALRKMPLDGIVFNCSGPVRPRVFPLSFATEILEKG